MPNNSINIQCAKIYGKSFRDYEVDRIQKSNLPDEIKILTLQKDEISEKIKHEIAKKWEAFLTGFINDYKKGTKAIKLKTDMEIRCGYCGKVIQYQGRNIHCTPAENGLQCQYCKSVNTV